MNEVASIEPSKNGSTLQSGAAKKNSQTLGTRKEADLIPRLRLSNGDIVARRIAYSHSVTGGADLSEMVVGDFYDEVEVTDSLLAKHFRAIQQDRIRSQFLRTQDVRIQEDESLKALQDLSIERDLQTDKIVTSLRKQREIALAPYDKKVDQASSDLAQLHVQAAKRFADAGAVYAPDHPSEEPIIRIDRMSEEEAAASLKLPHGDEIRQSALLPKWLGWCGTALSGVAFGVSLALAGGLLQGHEVFIRPKLWALLAASFVGMGLMALGRGWIRLKWHQFAEALWLKLSLQKQLSWFMAALASSVMASAVVITTDRLGILKAAQVRSAWSKGVVDTPESVYWIVAAAVTIFGFGYAIAEGLALGRRNPIENSLKELIEHDFRFRSEARRDTPQVQIAIEALNQVLAGIWRHRQAVTRADEIAGPFDELIARAESMRIPYPVDHTEEMRQRIEDALHDLQGIQIEHDALVSDFFAKRERSGK